MAMAMAHHLLRLLTLFFAVQHVVPFGPLPPPLLSPVGNPLPINEAFPGLQRVHANPDVYVIHDFLPAAACKDIIDRAKKKSLSLSPVAYAGWTGDVKELLGLAAKGPVSWAAIATAWLQTKDDRAATVLDFARQTVIAYPLFYALAAAAVTLFVRSRADGLQKLRTSTSTTLDSLDDDGDASNGARAFVLRAAELFAGRGDARQLRAEASLFEAPTIIRYEAGQVLKPHYDANRDADVEDANRGGQTLATLIVYLNDVNNGGKTRFGKLPAVDPTPTEPHLTVVPKMGDALLFFPADAAGRFDERTEHEGCDAVDEKYIARIWRHQTRVPPPFGLSMATLEKLAGVNQ